MIDLDHFISLMPDRANGANGPTMRDVLLSMSPEDRRAFGAQMEQSPDKASAWRRLNEDFAAIVNPVTATWPEPAFDAIVDEIPVNVKRLVSVVSLTNGRLLLRVVLPGTVTTLLELPTRLMTPTEFIFYTGMPIRRYMAELVMPRIAHLSHAASVLSVDKPIAYSVQYADGADADAKMHDIMLHVRCKEQIPNWALRHGYRLLDFTPFQGDLA